MNNCKTCSSSSVCTGCDSNLVLNNGQCSCDLGGNAYFNTTTKNCTCNSGYYFAKDTCCKTGTYYITDSCKNCDELFSTC
jgi:hypothetical protein